MNTSQNHSPGGRRLFPHGLTARPAASVVVALLVALAVWRLIAGRGHAPATQPTYRVQRENLTISMTEAGALKNRDRETVKSEVEGQTTILWIIPEGTNVHKGDLLLELDASKLMEQREQQQITVLNAEAAFIRARENLEVARNQATSDVAKAQLELRFAEIDRKKYEEGEYPGELQKAEADITIAREELQRAQDKVEWSRKLADEGFITRSEWSADDLAAKRCRINLELSEGKAKLLTTYTRPRKTEELASNVEQARLALERIRRKAAADVVQAEAEFKAKDSEFTRQQGLLAKVNRQIDKCKIAAPVDGMVVYATAGPRWGNAEPLAAGQAVRERQELIYLPTAAAMLAEVKVHESNLKKMRVGMPARITVDALAGRVFAGTVTRIALLPDAQSSWMNPDLKVFATEIAVEVEAADLRPGMSCRAEMIAEEHTNVVCVPVQAVVRVEDRTTVYVLDGTNGRPRTVHIGADNNRMVHVRDGLEPGETILLDPPLPPSAAPFASRTNAPPVPIDRGALPGNGSVTSPPLPSTADRNGTPARPARAKSERTNGTSRHESPPGP